MDEHNSADGKAKTEKRLEDDGEGMYDGQGGVNAHHILPPLHAMDMSLNQKKEHHVNKRSGIGRNKLINNGKGINGRKLQQPLLCIDYRIHLIANRSMQDLV